MKSNSRSARLELAIIALVALGIAILELYVDGFQRFVAWTAERETLLLTEIVSLAIILALGLSIYAWRRWREAVALEADKALLQRTVSSEQDAKRLMRSYAEAVTRGQEAERRRLARELHDDTIQQLIFLNQRLELIAFDHAGSPAAADLDKLQGVISQMIGNVRRYIQELRPTYLDELGLAAALRTLTKESRERTDLLVEFETTGTEYRLPETVELALYRIAQAALTNAVHHANALQATVLLEFNSAAVTLSLRDDGDGFAPIDESTLAKDGHFGLIGMRERAQLIGADYYLETKPGIGTTIIVSVSLPPTSIIQTTPTSQQNKSPWD